MKSMAGRFAWAATVFAVLCVGAPVNATAAPIEYDPTHARFTALLAKHVRDGRVDYRGLQDDRDELQIYLNELAAVTDREYDRWTLNERLAYLINLYNATVLDMVTLEYPIRRFAEIGGWFDDPFDLRTVRIFGYTITLRILTDNLLRRNYADPRVHLALCPASAMSPPLREEAYRADRLDEQLADQGRRFLSDPRWNRIDLAKREMQLAPVFRRYAEDFERAAGSVEAFVRGLLPPAQREAMKGRFDLSFRRAADRLNDLPASR